MRICFLSLEDIVVPPGGIATYLQNICVYLATKGHDVHVISRRFPGTPVFEEYKGVHIHRVSAPGPTVLYAPLFFYACRQEYKRLVREKRFELIHSDIPLMASLALQFLKTPPIVETVHATIRGLSSTPFRSKLATTNLNEVLTFLLSPVLTWLEHIRLNGSRKIIAVSEGKLCELIYQHPHLKAKTIVIPNGIEYEKFSIHDGESSRKLRKALGIGNDDKVILYLGRLMEQKRVIDLVQALPLIRTKMTNAKLVIIGRKNQYGIRLEIAVHELCLDEHVLMIDHVPYERVQDYYGIADVYAIPSSYEGFPFTILEAMASGIPVVAANIPGVIEQIAYEVTGLLHPVGDKEAIAGQIVRILSDEGLRDQIIQNALEMVKNTYTWEGVGSRTERLFSDVIQGLA